jgi:hypothetical protein
MKFPFIHEASTEKVLMRVSEANMLDTELTSPSNVVQILMQTDLALFGDFLNEISHEMLIQSSHTCRTE